MRNPRFPDLGWSSRAYASETDLHEIHRLLIEGRAASDDWRYWHIGDFAWNFFMVACHLEPREHIRLWPLGDGQLAAYAMLDEDATLDWQVRPELEWTGIEEEALQWASGLLTDLRKRHSNRWANPMSAGARRGDQRRTAFLEDHGFGRGTHTEINLLRPLADPIPAPAPAAGWQIRSVAGSAEAPARAAIQRDVWQPWSVGNIRDADYARFMTLPGYQLDLDMVAVNTEGILAAYANGWIDAANRIGDLGPVGARAAYRRQGLTRAVLLECLRRMQALGMDRVCISTGSTNTPALRLYESLGFTPVHEYHDYRMPA